MSTRRNYFLARVLLPACCWLPLVGQTYTFQAFAVPLETKVHTYGLGINNLGAVVGRMEFNRRNSQGRIVTAERGFKRFSGGVFEYPIIDPNDADFFTDATGINDTGVIVGRYRDLLGNFHAYILDQGNFTTVDVGGGPNTWITGINNAGDYVGGYGPQVPPFNGFVNHAGTISPVVVPGAQSTVPYGIAADGSIVGCAVKHNQVFVFVRGPQDNYQTFHIPNAPTRNNQCAYGINNVVHLIVGFYIDSAFIYHGFTYDYLADNSAAAGDAPVSVTTVDYPGAVITVVSGVNDKGEITGNAVLPTGSYIGFIGTPAK